MSYQTKQEQLQALCLPFPVEEVRTREEGGTTLHYYESSTIMKRLNEVMGGAISIESGRIEQYVADGKPRRIDMEVIVSLNWIDGTTSRLTGWGSSDIQYSKKDEWRIVSDYMKVAHTDGIKVALSKIGVGAELYDSTYRAAMVAKKEQVDKNARENAMFTCQECQGVITDGLIGKNFETREGVVQRTRAKFKKRLCIPCAMTAATVLKAVAR